MSVPFYLVNDRGRPGESGRRLQAHLRRLRTLRRAVRAATWTALAALGVVAALLALGGCSSQRAPAERFEPHPIADPAALERRHYCAACGQEIPARAWEALDYVGVPSLPYHFGACAMPDSDDDPDACGRIGD